MTGCSHGDAVVVVGGGDGGGCCYDGGGYGLGGYSASPPRPPPPHPPPPPPSPQAGACGEASGYNLCSTVLPCHRMSGCVGCGCDAPSVGDDGGGCAGVSLIQSSVAALPPLFGPPQPSAPVLGLKVAPGLNGSLGNPSSWGQLTSCFSAHPGKRKCNVMSHTST